MTAIAVLGTFLLVAAFAAFFGVAISEESERPKRGQLAFGALMFAMGVACVIAFAAHDVSREDVRCSAPVSGARP